MIRIREKEFAAILEHCRAEFPLEACGLLGGKKDRGNYDIEKVCFLTNGEKSRDRFSMIPKEQFQAVKDMRREGYLLLGNFHSHPKTAPWPSQEDKRLAYDTSFIYVIVSLKEKSKPQLKAYSYDQEKNVICETVEIIK